MKFPINEYPKRLKKYTLEQYQQMKDLREKGYTYSQIAKEVGCSPAHAHLVVTGKSYYISKYDDE